MPFIFSQYFPFFYFDGSTDIVGTQFYILACDILSGAAVGPHLTAVLPI